MKLSRGIDRWAKCSPEDRIILSRSWLSGYARSAMQKDTRSRDEILADDGKFDEAVKRLIAAWYLRENESEAIAAVEKMLEERSGR